MKKQSKSKKKTKNKNGRQATAATTAKGLFLTIEELQRLVPVSRAGAYKLAREIGKRVGRRLLVSRARFDAWLAAEVS